MLRISFFAVSMIVVLFTKAWCQVIPSIMTLTPDNITLTSARMHALASTNAVNTVVYFLAFPEEMPFSNTNGADTLIYIQGVVVDTEITTTMIRLIPNTRYGCFSVAVPDEGSALIGNTVYFTTASGPRGDQLIVPLSVYDKNELIRTVHFGVHTYATFCLDGSLGESEEPPLPPEVSVVLPRFRGTCLGGGSKMDLRSYFTPTQVDTYHIYFPTSPASYPVTFSWPLMDSLYEGNISLQTLLDTVDMKTSSSYTVTHTGIDHAWIIAEGPRPELHALKVVTQGILEWGMDWGRLSSLVYPRADTTKFWIEWDTSASFSNSNRSMIKELITKSSIIGTIDTIHGLNPSTMYYFRGVAQDSSEIQYSAMQSFRTSGVTNVAAQSAKPNVYHLQQNYPNPFNPVTTIRYDLPSAGYVSLQVYDVLGRHVMSVVEGVQRAGYKLVQLDASSLPSGLYIYRLTVGGYVEMRKMVVLK